MRTAYRIGHRFIALLLAVAMLLPSMSMLGHWITAVTNAGTDAEDYVIRDDALHFVIRHWHTDYDPDATRQDESAQKEGDDWFVVVEGYIVKLREGDEGYEEEITDPATGEKQTRYYRILLVDQNDGKLTQVSTNPTPYVKGFNRETGELTLAIKPRREKNPLYGKVIDEPEYIEYEEFCGVSLSAGRNAIEEQKEGDKTTGITIKYGDGNTHIVKGHIFYNSWNKTVHGSDSDVIFPTDEIDTAEVYTWKEEYIFGGTTYSDGDIITYTDGDKIIACYTKEDLKKAAEALSGKTDDDEIAAFIARYFSDDPTKFYSTKEGLHTNKTLVEEGSTGRLFLVDLEAWYVEGSAADIAFILDASGSMAFTADTPSIVNVYHAIANRVGIKELKNKDDDVVYAYQYTSKATGQTYTRENVDGDANNNYAELKAFIEELEKNTTILDEFIDTINDKLDSEFTDKNWETLFDRIGAIQKQQGNPSYVYPQRDKLIGYYTFGGSGDIGSYTTVAKQANNGNISFSTATGSPVISNGKLSLKQSNNGILLDSIPDGGSFTVSFTINKSATDGSNDQGYSEILYIGPADDDDIDNNYIHLIRDGRQLNFGTSPGNSQNRLRAYQGENSQILNVNNVFSDTTEKKITLVFSKGAGGVSLDLYINGTRTIDTSGDYHEDSVKLPEENIRIAFNGITDNYNVNNNAADLLVDDVFVFNTTLQDYEVSQLITAQNNKKGINDTNNADDINWNNVFILDDTVLEVLLNPHNTAHVELGVAAYNYFVYDANANTLEYGPLAYWEGTPDSKEGYTVATAGEHVIGVLTNQRFDGAGWYFLTHSGTKATIMDQLENAGTAKMLYGLATNTVSDYADWPGITQGQSNDGTGESYTPTSGESIPFYLDEYGNLRCFFSRSSGNACSYVYELADNQYVKTEALQRALAKFSAELSERSPASKLAAVRFSAELPVNVWEKLVLLDWTNDSAEFANIMSQKRGSGKASDHDKSITNGIEQYNYALTGSTCTYTGLGAYMDYLASTASRDDKVSKYLVIVTDGNDTAASIDSITYNGKSYTSGRELSKDIITRLKEDDYTIITLYLPGATALDEDGNINPNDQNYKNAKDFLTSLAGTKDTIPENAEKEGYFLASNDPQKLQELFDNKIMAQIVDSMEDYTVRDYIDPRFDLLEETVDEKTSQAVEIVWQLNANGQVRKKSADGSVEQSIDVTRQNVTIHLTRQCTPTARDPYLRYDEDKDMYYLEWVGQTIPTTPVGSTSLLPVWTAEFLLRAKDDFIGGNAILTNGNEEKMNWLFHPADISQASWNAYRDKLKQEFSYAFEHTLSASQRADYVKKYAEEHNKLWTRWSEVPQDERADVIAAYAEEKAAEKIKPSQYDACSNTTDMTRDYTKDAYGNNKTYSDYYPSKGFPRTVANVRLLPIETTDIEDILYMGEAITPKQMLLEFEDQYITKFYYLDYLKRYAYQRYVASGSAAQADMPLMELLSEWLGIDNNNKLNKEFSIPYMYLPNIKYDDETGKFDSDQKLNNTGTDAHEKDVVGILTYRWTLVDPTDHDAAANYVKNDTQTVVYSLTVEFTPLRIGDTLEGLNASNANGEIFARYIPIDGNEKDFNGFEYTFVFDRLKYVNGFTDEDKVDESLLQGWKAGYSLIEEGAYRWNSVYKPVEGNVQPESTDPGFYGEAKVINNDRTLQARTTYTKYVVSGGIALEVTLLIGELKEAAEAYYKANPPKDGTDDPSKVSLMALDDTGETSDDESFTFQAQFTLSATRSFVDNDFIESLKEKGLLDDYDEEFDITFEFNYSAEDIAKLIQDADVDANGYVTIYAKSIAIAGKFGTIKFDNSNQLPIGTYEFELQDINDAMSEVFGGLSFVSAGVAENENYEPEFFEESVLEGITSEKDNNNHVDQVDDANIEDFIVSADTKTDTVSFYVGTDSNDQRGDISDSAGNEYGWNDTSRYTNKRLGMLSLYTGPVRMTIRERGAEDGDNFIYHITGKTLGGKDVDLYVRVSAGGETTIDLLPGDYTVEELPDWSWKYENVVTFGGFKEPYDQSGEEDETWTIPEFIKAGTSLRSRDFDPIEEHKTVTFVHKRNDKVWLGGESREDNHFNP